MMANNLTWQQIKIARQERDDYGFWIFLRDGWRDAEPPGEHIILEQSQQVALSKAKGAIACSCCDECREEQKRTRAHLTAREG